MILTESIAIGMVVGFFFYEWIGFLPGGIVVPGYIALYWDRPLMILSTFGVSLLTLALIHFLSKVTILYGRRRFLLMIITGFMLQWLFDLLIIQQNIINAQIDTIGYIIPGLIANEMNHQGILSTLSILVILSVIVRLIMIGLGFLQAW